MEVLGATKHGNYDDALDWISIPRPPQLTELQPHDVLIQVAYSDVNPVDLQRLHGNQSVGTPVKESPFVPGSGGSGIVEDVGPQAPQHWKGKQVCFLADPARQGSYASHICVDSRCVALIPPTVEVRDAACIPVAGLTAYEALVKVGLAADKRIAQDGTLETVGLESAASNTAADIKENKTLLVIGGAGGVGSWIISLARAWHPNLRIIVTASTKAQHEWCKSLGATQVMKHDELTTQLQGGREGSVDIIVCLAEPTLPLFGACSEVIKPYGHICLVVADKGIESLNLGFCFFKGVTVVLQTVFSSIRTKYQHIVPADELRVILELMAKQTIRAPLSPDLDELLSERFKDALSENGVLKGLSQPHGRRGKLILRIHVGEDLIFMDLKTACLLQIPRRDCIQAKILRLDKKGDSLEWKEQTGLAERVELLKKITDHPTLGIVKVVEKQWQDYQDGLEMQEAENVKNLWGVKLKKRETNAKGEELLFVDPRSGALGEVSRKVCVASGIMTIEKGEDGQEAIKEAITDFNERGDVVHLIRQALKLSLNVE
jgi:NADPH2:quinone reductase